MTFTVIIVGLLLVVALFALVLNNVRKRRHRRGLLEQIRATKDAFVFLIDSSFEVKETNYYVLNPDVEQKPPYLLGNVLHCQTGTDCGECGTGFSCKTCPVRLVIKNAFQQKHGFENVVATMRLYDDVYKAQTVDVELSGELVYLDSEQLMLIRVKTLRSGK